MANKANCQPDQPCQRRSPDSHRLSFRSQRQFWWGLPSTTLLVTPCSWSGSISRLVKLYWISSKLDNQGWQQKQQRRILIGTEVAWIHKLVSPSEIRHSQFPCCLSSSRTCQCLSASSTIILGQFTASAVFPRLSHGIIARTGERQANNIFF